VEGRTYPVAICRDVAEHDRGANIAAVEDALTTDTVMLILGVFVAELTAVRATSIAAMLEAVRAQRTLIDPVTDVDGGPEVRSL